MTDAATARLADRLQLLDPLVPDGDTLVEAVLVLLVRREQRLKGLKTCTQPLDL